LSIAVESLFENVNGEFVVLEFVETPQKWITIISSGEFLVSGNGQFSVLILKQIKRRRSDIVCVYIVETGGFGLSVR